MTLYRVRILWDKYLHGLHLYVWHSRCRVALVRGYECVIIINYDSIQSYTKIHHTTQSYLKVHNRQDKVSQNNYKIQQNYKSFVYLKA